MAGTSTTRSALQIIDEQVRVWAQQHESRPGKRGKHWPLITLSREVGAGGSELALHLHERIGFALWDRDMVGAISSESGADRQMMESLDEHRHRAVEDAMLAAVLGAKSTNVQYLRSLQRVVRTISEHGHAIVVGRGANYICPPRSALRVRIVCPLEIRLKRYSEQNAMVRRRAIIDLERIEKERAEFVSQNFHSDVANPASYDLVINSASYTVEEMAAIVLSAYEAKFGRRPASNA